VFLIVLARWPQPGRGKSRLARDLGPDAAHNLECAFLVDTLGWARTHARLVVAFTPKGLGTQFSEVVPGAHLVAQVDGDLGARIGAAFDQAFELGAHRAVIVGSDSPTLPAHILSAAFDNLSGADVTLVPTQDGGFAAMGLARPQPRLLDQVAWSTRHTLRDVCANAAVRELAVALTPGWYDIDDRASLGRLAVDLRRDPHRAPATAAAMASLGFVDSSLGSRRE
jgi:rSAM/selenodomain-associated transferase 1